MTGGGPPRQSLSASDSSPILKGIVGGQQRPKSVARGQQSQGLVGVQGLSPDSPGLERPNTNLNTNNRTSGVNNSLVASYRGKSFGSPSVPMQNINSRGATPVRSGIVSKNPDNVRNSINAPTQAMKNLPAAHYPAMDSLSEKIKQAKLQKVIPTPGTGQRTMNVPTTPSARPPLHSGQARPVQQTTPIQQRPTTTSPAALNQRTNPQTPKETPNLNQQQQRRATTKTSQQSVLQDSRHKIEIVRKQTPSSSPQKYQREAAQTTATSPASGTTSGTASESDEKMEVDSITSECAADSDNTNNHEQNQSTDDADGSSASFAYLEEVIENPQNTVVQNQISGNTVKMLVVLQNGKQRLITFDIPNEPCTVQDLLEQV